MTRVRSEEPRIRLDGSVGKKPSVFYICESCGGRAKAQPSKLFPQIHIDHIDPVVPIGTAITDMTWDQYIERLFCDPKNLQALCTDCHNVKTQEENRERREIKKRLSDEQPTNHQVDVTQNGTAKAPVTSMVAAANTIVKTLKKAKI